MNTLTITKPAKYDVEIIFDDQRPNATVTVTARSTVEAYCLGADEATRQFGTEHLDTLGATRHPDPTITSVQITDSQARYGNRELRADLTDGTSTVLDCWFDDERSCHLQEWERTSAIGQDPDAVRRRIHDRDVAMIRAWV